jgi:hypothetical protein
VLPARPSPNSLSVLKDTLKEFHMLLPPIACHRRLGLVLFRWTLMLGLASLAACATHRDRPPDCKGPFTPINQSSSVVSNGPQR